MILYINWTDPVQTYNKKKEQNGNHVLWCPVVLFRREFLAHLHCRIRVPILIQTPNQMTTLFCTETFPTAGTRTWIPIQIVTVPIFTVCQSSVHGGGGMSASVHDEIHPPGSRQPLGSRHHSTNQTLPLHSACWDIRTTSGRYASYWNAYFLG